jgi:hypothetical protein
MDWNTITALVEILAWPVVVAIALIVFRKPLGAFLSGLSGRLTKLSVLDVSIELAELPQSTAPWNAPAIPQSSEMTGGEVSSTALMTLFGRIEADETWDYLIVDVKDGRFWLVSRVFVFTVFLQAMRGLKCMVFVQSSGEIRRRFLGLASPEAVRAALGEAFPWLEKALKNALSQSRNISGLSAPALPPMTAGEMIRSFIEDREMRLSCDPAEMIKSPNNCQIPAAKRPTDPIKPAEWERLGEFETWEHTHWLDLGIREVSEAVTRSFGEWDSSHYKETPGVSNEERIRELLRRKTRYIARVNSRGEFEALLDRQKLAALVGEAMVNG